MATEKQDYLAPSAPIYLSTGGLETTLQFKTEFPLREFAAFEVILSDKWRPLFHKEIQGFVEIALRYKLPLMVDTPTWRASTNWFDKLGTSTEDRRTIFRRSLTAIREAIATAQEGRDDMETKSVPHILIRGTVGPMSDAYRASDVPSIEAAQKYHAPPINAWAEAGVSEILSATIPSSIEATGIARAAAAANLPSVIGFVIGTNGKLPSGETLQEAVCKVDQDIAAHYGKQSRPLFFIVNCIHSMYIAPVVRQALDNNEQWVYRLGGVLANASAKSHDELDNCDTIDEGDPSDWAKQVTDLHNLLPTLKVLGGCCGTGHEHCEEVAKILQAWRNKETH